MTSTTCIIMVIKSSTLSFYGKQYIKAVIHTFTLEPMRNSITRKYFLLLWLLYCPVTSAVQKKVKHSLQEARNRLLTEFYHRILFSIHTHLIQTNAQFIVVLTNVNNWVLVWTNTFSFSVSNCFPKRYKHITVLYLY